ncbi:uncharacterized protein LOC125226665 isoform X4 [Leguminivora glycinivorella]|uniref:uncharacterized protein LOC125226665 isoform X4 n=1 Tax=Leguminivora glycinivorella TaxID=1035111 RepID=UPI00200E6E7B|nr:uncharacterized protein LOC125226665 isoform X4 [Leguminivora glycinivorella]XP_047986677.1 uncharacterized protein LOC125226665 isoform X4 [Leguminivora glycinivorella]
MNNGTHIWMEHAIAAFVKISLNNGTESTDNQLINFIISMARITFSSTWRSKQQVHVNDNLNLLGPAITDKKSMEKPHSDCDMKTTDKLTYLLPQHHQPAFVRACMA